jgi:hypothetical protein
LIKTVFRWCTLIACVCPSLSLNAAPHNKCSDTTLASTPACNEVTVGVEVWSYERLYPLLDGLFQDVASTSVSSLSLSPNSSNGSQLDALAQSFQLQLGFNQLSAAQNQAAAQMLNGNTAFQSTLLQQQGSLLQQLMTSQTILTQASNTLLKDQNSNQPPNVITADTQAQTQAQNNLNSLTAQMTALNDQLKAPTWSPNGASASLANATPTFNPLSVSSLWSSSNSSSPSFPATKQMDNQIQLLWERLSRLMGVMVRPDSAKDTDAIYLVHFNTGIFPSGRKHQLLDIRYKLTCTGSGTGAPTVIDIYPRMAAVNITDTKYRDSQVGFGAVLAWFGVGVNAGYNREHMRISQLLGQSSYITGYGVGQSAFGWEFGIPLGDDQLPPDTRDTFVLLSARSGCEPSLTRTSAQWVDSSGKPNERQDANSQTAEDLLAWANVPKPPKVDATFIQSIDFNRAEYDPTTVTLSSPVVVSMTLHLNQDIDQQATITVNGVVLRRARDAFGRAISAGGSGGLLESQTLGDNTWIPISSRTLLLNLDGTMFGDHFPEIIIASPRSINNISKEIASAPACPVLTVSGHDIDTAEQGDCFDKIPSISYKKAAVRPITAVRILQGLHDQNDDHYRVMFTDLGAGQAASTASGSSTDIRVISNTTQSNWSAATEVYESDTTTGKLLRLHCDPQETYGSKLICDLPAHGDHPPDETLAARYEIIDTAHILDGNNTVGAIKGWATIGSCDDKTAGVDTCKIPTYWNIKGPVPTSLDDGWTLTVEFVNVNTHNAAEPTTATLGQISATSLDSAGENHPVKAVFTILPAQISLMQDSMLLTLKRGDLFVQKVQISNLLSNVRPVATTISSDSRTWTGMSLLHSYSALKIGDNGASHVLLCTGDDVCEVDPAEDLTKDKAGFIYLTSKAATGPVVAVPLMSKTATGTMTYATFTPSPPAGKGNVAPGPQGNANVGTSIPGPTPQVGTTPIVATQNVTAANN